MLPCRQQWFDDRHGSVVVGRLLAHAALLERNRWLEFAVLAELATSSSEGSQPNEKKKGLSSEPTDSVVGENGVPGER